jgi:peptidoglycan/xylan/chitin deacetylase (PgdA/CDA1 family)
MKFSRVVEIIFISWIISSCSRAPATQEIPTPTKESIYFKNTVVSLTFDDGNADNYYIRPILADDKLHATFYIVSGFTGASGFMTEEQLRGLHEDGNEIGGHTLNHTKLTDVRGADLKREVCQDRLNLLAHGFEVASFAFPYGYYDEEARQTVMDCGYNSARIVTDGPDIVPPGDAYALQAMPYVVNDTDFSKLVRYVTGAENEGGGWVILVFHHVCDGCNQYAIDMDTFTKFASWLGYQRDVNGLVIKTVNEVVGGKIKPGVEP